MIKRLPQGDFQPLRRISPSQVQRLLDCPLRLVLRNTYGELLPPTVYTYFGSAVHDLFQWAVQTGVRDEAGLRQYLEESLEAQHQKCREAGYEALLPLKHNVKNYGLRYNAALRKAASFPISDEPTDAPPGTPYEPSEKVEEWLSGFGGKLAGRADLIRYRDGYWELVDYKTGLLTDSNGALKPEYLAQMKLYAFMMRETLGIHPDKIWLEPLVGEPVELSFSPEECRAFADEVVAVLTKTNLHWREADWPILARPDKERCHSCESRPACPAYQPEPGRERFGTVECLREAGDTTTIFFEDGQRVIRVSSAASSLLREGQSLRLFSLKPAGPNASEWAPTSWGFIQ
ncbi:MAG: PD-(D/E)XK nuclease family protein [Cytophagaceae bacterium]|nr:PD-(D/E)XK nuclease family protein [Cytophagaceae bacterium]